MRQQVKYQAWDTELKVMIRNPIINGSRGTVLMEDRDGFIIGDYPKERMILRQFTGSLDFFGAEIWEWDKLYAKDNGGGEEYIGYVIYSPENAKFVVCSDRSEHSGYGFIPNECYVKGNIHEPDPDGTLIVGECDLCSEEARYLKELRDRDGIHLMNGCYYGCKDRRSIPDEGSEDIEVVSVIEVNRSECHDSEWAIVIKADGVEFGYHLTRLNSETKENLHSKILACKNRMDVQRLNQYVFHN